MMEPTMDRVIILGAAGRDFHDLYVYEHILFGPHQIPLCDAY